MNLATTDTGSLAVLVRVTEPLYAWLAQTDHSSEDAPIYRDVVADLGTPDGLVGPGLTIPGTAVPA